MNYVSIHGGAVNNRLKWFFFQCIGPHVLLKLILGLKNIGWCVVGCWLTIYSIQTSFFLAAAYWRRRNEQQFLRMYTSASQSHYLAMD
jgi:hypothetical protein